MSADPNRCSSIHTPKDWLASTRLIVSEPSIILEGWVSCADLYLEQISIYSVLVTFKLNLFARSHSLMDSKSLLASVWVCLSLELLL